MFRLRKTVLLGMLGAWPAVGVARADSLASASSLAEALAPDRGGRGAWILYPGAAGTPGAWLVALRDDGTGRPARWDLGAALEETQIGPGPSAVDVDSDEAQEIFDRLGLEPWQRQGAQAEALLEEEVHKNARSAPLASPSNTPALAVGSRGQLFASEDGFVFLATRTEVWRFSADEAPARWPQAGVSGVAAIEGGYVFATETGLVWTDANGQPTQHPALPANLATGPIDDVLTLPNSGGLWALSDGNLWHLPLDGADKKNAMPLAVPGPILAVQQCQGSRQIVIASAQGMWKRLEDGRVSRLPNPGQAIEAMACNGRALVATGAAGLIVLPSQGLKWHTQSASPVKAVVALIDHFVALEPTGVVTSIAPDGSSPEPPISWVEPDLGLDGVPTGSQSQWLPRLVVRAQHVVGKARAPGSDRVDKRWNAWLSAEFPLGAAPRAPIERNRPRQPPSVQRAPLPPCLAALRAEAVERAMVSPGRIRDLLRRTQRAGWLPEIRFRVEKRLGRSESVDIKDDLGPAPFGVDTVDDLRMEARVTWDLSQILLHPRQVQVWAQTTRMNALAEDVRSAVNRAFFARRRLHAAVVRVRGVTDALGDDAGPDLGDDDADVRLAEAEAQLETLAGPSALQCH